MQNYDLECCAADFCLSERWYLQLEYFETDLGFQGGQQDYVFGGILKWDLMAEICHYSESV